MGACVNVFLLNLEKHSTGYPKYKVPDVYIIYLPPTCRTKYDGERTRLKLGKISSLFIFLLRDLIHCMIFYFIFLLHDNPHTLLSKEAGLPLVKYTTQSTAGTFFVESTL